MSLKDIGTAQFLALAALDDDFSIAVLPISELSLDDFTKKSLTALSQYGTLVHFVDPVSWASIGKYLLRALISSGLNAALEKLFGGTVDPEELLRAFFREVIEALRRTLEEQWLRETTAKLRGLKASFEAYARSPDSRRDLLPGVTILSDELDAIVKEIGPPAIGVSAIATTLRLAAHLEYAKSSNSKGDWLTVCSVHQEFAAHVEKMEGLMPSICQNRFGPVRIEKTRRYGSKETDGPWDVYYWRYRKDGTWGCPLHDDEQKVRGLYLEDKNRTLKSMLEQTIVPARALAADMRIAIEEIKGKSDREA